MPATSLWERLESPPPTQRTALSPARIAEAAVCIADAEGIDAVTMRALATALGVAPMAAYRYVSGKDDLLLLMVDHVYAELTAPTTDLDWRSALRGLALDTRDMLLRHPWLTHLSSSRVMPMLTPNRMAVTEWALLALKGCDLPVDAAMVAAETLDTYTRGRTGAEVEIQRLMADRQVTDGHGLRVVLAPQMAWLMDTGRYPTVRRHLIEASHKDDRRRQFEAGLDCVLDGIAVRMGI